MKETRIADKYALINAKVCYTRFYYTLRDNTRNGVREFRACQDLLDQLGLNEDRMMDLFRIACYYREHADCPYAKEDVKDFLHCYMMERLQRGV